MKKEKTFWRVFTILTLTFFITLIVISFTISIIKALFSNDFSTAFNHYLESQNWLSFFGIKLIAALLYGLYVTNKNLKTKKRL